LKWLQLAPVLRGLCSSYQGMIGHFTDDKRVLQFINSKDLEKLAPLGTSCPDHFLRTKIQPLVLGISPKANLEDFAAIKAKIEPDFEQYRKEYTEYYEKCKYDNSPAAITEYTALPRQEAFDIEYWLLEEAKLQRQPKEKPLSRKVAFITGAGGGIGKAIADKLAEEGANVVLTDISEDRLKEANATYKRDISTYAVCDVTNSRSIADAYEAACLEFGGVDIIVHSAGLAISKALADTTLKDWDILQRVKIM